jgi:hypothetical protein
MTEERWKELMRDQTLPLTKQEIADGWHFCPEWDGLLIGPGEMEWEFCMCPADQRRRGVPLWNVNARSSPRIVLHDAAIYGEAAMNQPTSGGQPMQRPRRRLPAGGNVK